MKIGYDPDKHHRRSIRLRGYDYSQAGAYFITICTQSRECLLGEIVDGEIRLNEAGKIVADIWDSLATRFPDIDLDAFVVMPNHIHGIIVLTDWKTPYVGAPLVGAPGSVERRTTTTRATTRGAPTSLGMVVGAFKSLTTVEFVRGVKTLGWPPFAGKLWQHNYYEHIIRNTESLNKIREYIATNPARWSEDTENPENPENPKTRKNRVGAPLVGAHLVDVRPETTPSAESAATKVSPIRRGDDEAGA
jgi:putative transposase